MTREEAKKEWIARAYHLEGYRFDEIIDNIYDDFESRTCESCKHMAIYNRREVRCSKGVVESRALDNNSKSFGCNKWESK